MRAGQLVGTCLSHRPHFPAGQSLAFPAPGPDLTAPVLPLTVTHSAALPSARPRSSRTHQLCVLSGTLGASKAPWGPSPGLGSLTHPGPCSPCAESPDEVTGSQASSLFMGHQEGSPGGVAPLLGIREENVDCFRAQPAGEEVEAGDGAGFEPKAGESTAPSHWGVVGTPALRTSLWPQ